MIHKTTILFAILALASAKVAKSDEVSFKNVIVRAYSMYTYKFNVTIENSNSLKEHIPKKVFDKLEIVGSNIPILYENSITDIDALDELILNDDGIQELRPGCFKDVPQLRKLVIQNNKIEQINKGVFNELNIAALDLSKNSISTVDAKAFNDMPDLLNINLADNKLKVWNKNWFANTPLLSRVSFQNNLIQEIPADAFKNFQGEKQFGSIPLTINIILSHNKINKIHRNAFKSLKKINNLWLDNNQLEDWDESLLSGVAVRDFRIDENKIKCLSGDFSKIFVADSTHIDGNPWDCECLKMIEGWTAEHGREVILSYSKMSCDAERIERKLKDLNTLLQELRKNETSR